MGDKHAPSPLAKFRWAIGKFWQDGVVMKERLEEIRQGLGCLLIFLIFWAAMTGLIYFGSQWFHIGQ